MDNEQKREKIKSILIDVAETKEVSEEYCKSILNQLDTIYNDDFRHFYSDITTLLLSINKRGISIDLFGENIRTICEFAAEKNFPHIDKLNKLNDHITMDLARIKEWSSLIDSQKDTYIDIKTANSKMNELEAKMIETTKNLKDAYNKISFATKESVNVKKDLISIMGVFMGIFSFIQWNFSQYKDLLEYDPFNRVLYIAILNSLLIISLYIVFAIIDFIVHRNPRMTRPFFNPENKSPTKFFLVSGLAYLIFLFIAAYNLHSDTGRKTISKLENKIENLKTDNSKTNQELNNLLNRKISELNKVIDEKNQKIMELENKIENIKKFQTINQIETKLKLKNFKEER